LDVQSEKPVLHLRFKLLGCSVRMAGVNMRFKILGFSVRKAGVTSEI